MLSCPPGGTCKDGLPGLSNNITLTLATLTLVQLCRPGEGELYRARVSGSVFPYSVRMTRFLTGECEAENAQAPPPGDTHSSLHTV